MGRHYSYTASNVLRVPGGGYSTILFFQPPIEDVDRMLAGSALAGLCGLSEAELSGELPLKDMKIKGEAGTIMPVFASSREELADRTGGALKLVNDTHDRIDTMSVPDLLGAMGQVIINARQA